MFGRTDIGCLIENSRADDAFKVAALVERWRKVIARKLAAERDACNSR